MAGPSKKAESLFIPSTSEERGEEKDEEEDEEDEEDEEEDEDDEEDSGEEEKDEDKRPEASPRTRRPPVPTGKQRKTPCKRCEKGGLKCFQQAVGKACVACAKRKQRCEDIETHTKPDKSSRSGPKVGKGRTKAKRSGSKAGKRKREDTGVALTSAPNLADVGTKSAPIVADTLSGPARRSAKKVKSPAYVDDSDEEGADKQEGRATFRDLDKGKSKSATFNMN